MCTSRESKFIGNYVGAVLWKNGARQQIGDNAVATSVFVK